MAFQMARISRVAVHIWRVNTRDLKEDSSMLRMLQAINMKTMEGYGNLQSPFIGTVVDLAMVFSNSNIYFILLVPVIIQRLNASNT